MVRAASRGLCHWHASARNSAVLKTSLHRRSRIIAIPFIDPAPVRGRLQ